MKKLLVSVVTAFALLMPVNVAQATTYNAPQPVEYQLTAVSHDHPIVKRWAKRICFALPDHLGGRKYTCNGRYMG